MARETVELRELDTPALLERLAETKQEAFNLRFQHATGQLENTARLRDLRRQIARINTLLRQQEISAAESDRR